MIIPQGRTISCSLCVWRRPKRPATHRFLDSGFCGQPEALCEGPTEIIVSSTPLSMGSPSAWRDCVTSSSRGGLDGLDVVTFWSCGHSWKFALLRSRLFCSSSQWVVWAQVRYPSETSSSHPSIVQTLSLYWWPRQKRSLFTFSRGSMQCATPQHGWVIPRPSLMIALTISGQENLNLIWKRSRRLLTKRLALLIHLCPTNALFTIVRPLWLSFIIKLLVVFLNSLGKLIFLV